MFVRRRASVLVVVAVLSVSGVAAGCGGGDDGPAPGQIGRIDGPATGDEDNAGVEQEGAPAGDVGSLSGQITNDS